MTQPIVATTNIIQFPSTLDTKRSGLVGQLNNLVAHHGVAALSMREFEDLHRQITRIDAQLTE